MSYMTAGDGDIHSNINRTQGIIHSVHGLPTEWLNLYLAFLAVCGAFT